MKRSSFFILFILLFVTMIGCASTQPTIGTTSNTQNDSIRIRTEYVHDTTIIEKLRLVIQKPDTVYIHDSTVVYKYRDRWRTDTLFRYHSDTIRIVEEKLVEKEIAPFVRNSCIALWSVVGVAILALVAWIVWKFATGKLSLASILSKFIIGK